ALWPATAAPISSRCSSTSRAAASRFRRHERSHPAARHLAFPDRRDDPALLVSSAVVLAAAAGIDVLADPPGHHLGLPAAYIAQNAGYFARAGGTLIGAVILWDILFRGQLGFSISFLEEMWARNLGNLMMSPLKPIEFLAALMAMSLIRLAIGVIPMMLLALYVFGFNFFGLGLPAIAFFCNLIFTSWAVGIFVSGLVLRNGLGAESIVWTLMFALMPLAC